MPERFEQSPIASEAAVKLALGCPREERLRPLQIESKAELA